MEHGRRRTESTGLSLSDASAMLSESAARAEARSWNELLLAANIAASRNGTAAAQRSKPMAAMPMDGCRRSSPHSAHSLPAAMHSWSPAGRGHNPPSPIAVAPFVGPPLVVRPGGGQRTAAMTPPRFVSVLVPPMGQSVAVPPPPLLPPGMPVNTPPSAMFMPPPPPHMLNGVKAGAQTKRKELSGQATKYEFAIGEHRVEQMNNSKAAVMQHIGNVHVALLNAHPNAPPKHQVVRITGDRPGVNKALHMIRRMYPAKQYPDINLLPLPPGSGGTACGGGGQAGSPHSGTPMSQSPLAAVRPPACAAKWVPMPEGVALDCTLAAVQHGVRQFFCVQHTHPTFPQLESVHKAMQTAYGGDDAPALPQPAAVGSLCALSVDGQWWRALLVRDGLVRLVDRGGYVKAAHEQLRQIRSDFAALPFQATECRLADVPPSSGDSARWTDAFCQLAEAGALRVTCAAPQAADGRALVSLEAAVDGQWLDVAAHLAEAMAAEEEAGNVNSVLGGPLVELDEHDDDDDEGNSGDYGGFDME